LLLAPIPGLDLTCLQEGLPAVGLLEVSNSLAVGLPGGCDVSKMGDRPCPDQANGRKRDAVTVRGHEPDGGIRRHEGLLSFSLDLANDCHVQERGRFEIRVAVRLLSAPEVLEPRCRRIEIPVYRDSYQRDERRREHAAFHIGTDSRQLSSRRFR
jgi:hypothetical protein